MKFIKVVNDMFPDNRVESFNLNANIGGRPGVEVKLFGYPDVYQYTGEYATMAADLLEGFTPEKSAPTPETFTVTRNGQPIQAAITGADGTPLTIVIEGRMIAISDIEWVNFAASINGITGIQMRLASDPAGQLCNYTGEEVAGRVYDQLAALAGETEETQQAAG